MMLTYSDMNVLITGASSGLGRAVSKRFAQLGANTILLCRSKELGDAAVLEIEKAVPDSSVRLMICDLASMESIDQFIADFTADYATLDLLFNNAAVMKRDRTVTEDGFEMMFQVNYLAPFILMNSLLEPVRNSDRHLVLNNGRPSDKLRLDLDDLQSTKRYRMYGSFFQTKLCLLLASIELAQRAEGDGVSIHMADPGTFRSGLVREVAWFGWLKNMLSATAEEAAENILHVARSEEAVTSTGMVFRKRQEWPLAPYWKGAEVRGRLWSVTEAMLEENRRH
jgi:NAD(P)-dependent dehydrogenase (short-subunit alcohol dehydrogenase family)